MILILIIIWVSLFTSYNVPPPYITAMIITLLWVWDRTRDRK